MIARLAEQGFRRALGTTCPAASHRIIRGRAGAAQYPPSGTGGSSRAVARDRQDLLEKAFASQLDADVEALEPEDETRRFDDTARTE